MKRYMGPFERKTKTDIVTPGTPLNGIQHYNIGAPNESIEYVPGSIPDATRYYDTFITPRFEKLVGEGYIIQCPFTLVNTSFSALPGTYGTQQKEGDRATVTHSYSNICTMFQGGRGWYAMKLNPYSFPGRQAAATEALTRAYAKANSGDADLLIDLIQFRSMIDMFMKAGKTLLALVRTPGAFLDLVKAHLRGDERYVRIPPSGKKVPVSSLEGLWCELRFGWRPLLSTLEGIVDAFNRTDLDQARRITYRATEEIDYVQEEVSTGTLVWTFGCLVINEPVRTYTENLTYRSSFRAGVLLEDSTSMWRALGLDSREIPIALWDCVPYSFIVDRFVNVGNWLRSLRPIPSKDFGGSWVAERFTVEHRLRTEFLPFSRSCGTGTEYRYHTRFPGFEEGLTKIEGYVRSIHESAPLLPTLRHDWSKLQNLYNLIDAIMLAIQSARPAFNGRRN